MDANVRRRVESVTAAELDCLALVARHHRSSEIAFRLSLSQKTVDNRISRAMKRLEVADRDSAVRLLIEASRTPWGKTLAGFSTLEADAIPEAPRRLSRLPWPWPTRSRPVNDHPFVIKIAIVLGLAATMMLATAGYLLVVLMLDRATAGRGNRTETSMIENSLETPRRIAIRAGRAVTQALLPHENDLDASIISAAVVLQRIAQARIDMAVPAETVQPALAEAATAIARLVDARASSVASHSLLAGERDRLGFTAEDFGCTAGKFSGRRDRSDGLKAA